MPIFIVYFLLFLKNRLKWFALGFNLRRKASVFLADAMWWLNYFVQKTVQSFSAFSKKKQHLPQSFCLLDEKND
ncbi:MAG: hypothetical protein EAZ57_02745 [Cytophagales bacterium]|nr:MAG: hypothetical protein EAZ67_03210 [Cytophagales bacterium]TAF61680.1 MAG: hypothetical protein EAZ57_02745 [Cytophagales bacterium]